MLSLPALKTIWCMTMWPTGICKACRHNDRRSALVQHDNGWALTGDDDEVIWPVPQGQFTFAADANQDHRALLGYELVHFPVETY
jgi:hypothetical protein